MIDCKYMTEAFVYVWNNTTNGCKYVGYHMGSPDDGYISSSSSERFWSDFKNPAMVWDRKILFSGTRDECLKYEQQILREADLKSDIWYNNARGAEVIFTDEVRNKIRVHHIGGTSGMLGKYHSDETKQKLSLARKGIPLSETHKQNLRKPKNDTSNMIGHKRSNETRMKIRAAAIKRMDTIRGKPRSSNYKPTGAQQKMNCPYCGLEGSIMLIKGHHIKKCKDRSWNR